MKYLALTAICISICYHTAIGSDHQRRSHHYGALVEGVLIVHCPKESKVLVDGKSTVTTGEVRQYSIGLRPGVHDVEIRAKDGVRHAKIKLHHKQKTYFVKWAEAGQPSKKNPSKAESKGCEQCEKVKSKSSAHQSHDCPHCSARKANPLSPVFKFKRGVPRFFKRYGATIDAGGHLNLDNGRIELLSKYGEQLSQNMTSKCEHCRQFSIEVVLHAAEVPQDIKDNGLPRRIMSFSKDEGPKRNFTLGQSEGLLVFRLANTKKTYSEYVVAKDVEVNQPTHVIVTYVKEHVVCYVNGKKTLSCKHGKVGWIADGLHLVLGDEHNGKRNWKGSIERFAIYGEGIDAATAAKLFQHVEKDYR